MTVSRQTTGIETAEIYVGFILMTVTSVEVGVGFRVAGTGMSSSLGASETVKTVAEAPYFAEI